MNVSIDMKLKSLYHSLGQMHKRHSQEGQPGAMKFALWKSPLCTEVSAP